MDKSMSSQYLSGYTSTDDDTANASLTCNIKEENTFKILIASDIHLGFCDTDPARENDSFTTFEEILKLGRDEDVDFVLLGGDLFHDNKPKPSTLQRAMEIMRKYCLGNKAIEFEYLGDPKIDFPNQDEPEVNFMNPDVNIAMPVFTIHGNHDDPVGTKKTSAVDHLVAAKLLNHFGQWDNLNHINVKAVPFLKGETRLALFGLGNLKDERLYRLIHNNEVKFVRPKENADDWFNIFVLHQNRVAHGPKNYIPESFIAYFFDIAIWGHEHECRITPEHSSAGDVKTWIIQPGSPVATSLCAGEAKQKRVGILSVNKRRFRLEERNLDTVRPMMLKDIDLVKILPTLRIGKDKDIEKAVETYVNSQIELLLGDAKDKITGHPAQPTEPLVRVRVFHEDVSHGFNPVRFSQKFVGKIVNDDIVMFKKVAGKRNANGEMEFEEMDELFKGQDQAQDLDSHVEAIVETYFQKARENQDSTNILEVLSEKGLSEAVKSCVEKDDKDALGLVIQRQVEKVCEHLMKKAITEENIEEELEAFRVKRWAKPEEDGEEALNLLKSRPVRRAAARDDDEDEDNEDVDEEDEVSMIEEDDEDEAPTRRGGSKGAAGRGRGGGRGKGKGAAAPRGGRGRGKSNATTSSFSNDDGDDSSDTHVKGGKGSRGGRGRGRGGATRGKAAARKSSSPAATRNKPMIQTTLNVQTRRSPRKGTMVFDVSDSDD